MSFYKRVKKDQEQDKVDSTPPDPHYRTLFDEYILKIKEQEQADRNGKRLPRYQD